MLYLKKIISRYFNIRGDASSKRKIVVNHINFKKKNYI